MIYERLRAEWKGEKKRGPTARGLGLYLAKRIMTCLPSTSVLDCCLLYCSFLFCSGFHVFICSLPFLLLIGKTLIKCIDQECPHTIPLFFLPTSSRGLYHNPSSFHSQFLMSSWSLCIDKCWSIPRSDIVKNFSLFNVLSTIYIWSIISDVYPELVNNVFS